MAGGIDHRKLALLLAILEKRCGYPMATHDVFVSVAGGLRLTEPGLDLAILTAIASSLTNKPVPSDMLVIGEVGLSGEVRAVVNIDHLVSEAGKLGFKSVVLPESNRPHVSSDNPELVTARDLQSALDRILG